MSWTSWPTNTLITQLVASETKKTMCAGVAEIILLLKQRLKAVLEEKGHGKLMRDIEMPLVNVLAAMEYEGVRDTKVLEWMSGHH